MVLRIRSKQEAEAAKKKEWTKTKLVKAKMTKYLSKKSRTTASMKAPARNSEMQGRLRIPISVEILVAARLARAMKGSPMKGVPSKGSRKLQQEASSVRRLRSRTSRSQKI